jgi:hypothetical protein
MNCGMRRFDKHRVDPPRAQTAQAAEMEARLAAIRAEREGRPAEEDLKAPMVSTEDLKNVGYTPWRTPSVGAHASSRSALGRLQ